MRITNRSSLSLFLNCLVAGALAHTATGATWYVDDDAPPDGLPGVCDNGHPENGSAMFPFDGIQEALDAAADNDEIIVRNGIYTGPCNTELDFAGKDILLRSETGPSNCRIDGGGTAVAFIFDGGETTSSEIRGINITNCTDVGSGGAVKCEGSSPRFRGCWFLGNHSDFSGGAVLIDGSGGGASPEFIDCVFHDNTAGGGTYEAGGACSMANDATPLFDNCDFANNSAVHGGAVYVAESQPTFTDCEWTNNSATEYGGAMHIEQHASVTLQNSTFANNIGNLGGAVSIYAASATLTTCEFNDNQATAEGGGMYVESADGITASASLADCDFSLNIATARGGAVRMVEASQVGVEGGTFLGNSTLNSDGGGFASSGGSELSLDNATMTQNYAVTRGGAVANLNSTLAVSNCDLIGNTAEERGGAIFNAASVDATILHSLFLGNTTTSPADGRGGAISNGQSPATIEGCTFDSNLALTGGAIHNALSDATILGCTFELNVGFEGGGGVFNSASGPYVSWCLFDRNSTDASGGAIHSTAVSGACQPVIHNCGFYANEAVDAGGALHCDDGCVADVANCLFTGNTVTHTMGGGSGGAIRAEVSTVNAFNCTLSCNHADTSGGGVSSVDGSLVTIFNSILWNNDDATGVTFDAQMHVASGGNATADYSCVQHWPGGGTGMISTSPNFTDADGADDICGTLDDNLHLFKGSPCADAADNTAVPPDATDLDDNGDDTERTPLDLDANRRFRDDEFVANTGVPDPPDYPEPDIVDMGAYERCTGDLDGDGDTDQADLGIFLADWGCTGGGCAGDVDADGDTDQSDLGIILADYNCGT